MRSGKILALSLAIAALAFPAVAAPDEQQLGKAAGYPIGKRGSWFYDESVRVGSFSNLDKFLAHYTLNKSASPLPLPAAATETKIEYRFENATYTLDDFLAHQRVTGLLLIKDGEVLFERYQYERNAANRFVSHSMAKSIVSIAIGMALAEGKIASLDDKVAKYEPKLAGHAYGETSIRNLLRMSSGVAFKEVYDGNDDLARFSRLRVSRKGRSLRCARSTPAKSSRARGFITRRSRPSSWRSLLRAVTGKTLSEYLTPRLWQPMGAEADATWIRTSDGLEVAAGSFNAILRDYGRLGMLLANDGARRNEASRAEGLSARCDRLAPATRRVRTAASHAVFRLWLSVLALPRRKTPVCAARRLRTIDLRRSRTEACDGDYGCREKRQRRQRVVGARARRGLARICRSTTARW